LENIKTIFILVISPLSHSPLSKAPKAAHHAAKNQKCTENNVDKSYSSELGIHTVEKTFCNYLKISYFRVIFK